MQSSYSDAFGINTIQLPKAHLPKYFIANQSTIVFDSTPDTSHFSEISTTLAAWSKFIPGTTCSDFGLNNCPEYNYRNDSFSGPNPDKNPLAQSPEYTEFMKSQNFAMMFNKYSLFVASAVNMGILQISDLTFLASNTTARGPYESDSNSIGKGPDQGTLNFYVL